MTTDDLDHHLASHVEIVPSSGFTESVMSAVRDEAWTTPPLRFPWRRLARGPLMAVVAIAVAVASGVVSTVPAGPAPSAAAGMSSVMAAIGGAAIGVHAGWLALALLLTGAAIGLSFRVVSRRHG